MWFGENEKRARNSDGQNNSTADNAKATEQTNAPMQSSIEDLLNRRIENHSYRLTQKGAYPY